ncbi:hypothetical protein CTAYLR_003705 [Chrysophaeum taylorii]|uniref:Uncharacterized protein n=1 Tax=Chrysophaeum taylorii TaxID=2483200 RepID=A0AAD7XMR9_9STRA|nr:hypothetical protein CTAYLR_003705 [Chrysophaeum taylorii]
MKVSFEEQLVLLSVAAVVFALGWLLLARTRRGAPKRVTTSDLEHPLMGQVETEVVKSRVPLALRQVLFYSAAAYYLIAATVYAVRRAKGHGPDSENLARVVRCVADVLRCVAWIVALKADAAEYRSSSASRHTFLMFAFVAVSAVGAAREVHFDSFSAESPSVWALVAHVVFAGVAIHAVASPHVVLRVATQDNPPSPEERAVELHEIVGFTWLGDVFETKRTQAADEKLEESHLPRMMEGDTVAATWPKLRGLVADMRADVARAKRQSKKVNKTLALFTTLVVLAKGHFACAGALRFFYVFSGYLQPLALYIILKRFGRDDALGWASVGLLFFGPVLNAALDNLQMFVQRRVATRCRGALMVLIYDKGTRLDMSAGTGRVGEVVSLMSADIQNVLMAVAYFHWVWGPVLQLAVTLTALFWLVGLAAFGALAVMWLNSVGNAQIFKRLTKLNKDFLGARSKRMELITEMLQGARIVKMLSFERGIAGSVAQRRDVELGILKKLLDCFVGIFTLINSTPPLMGAATFMLLTSVLGRRFDAAEGFTTLTLLDNLRFVLLQAPASINYIITGWASLQRIEEFLDAPEVDDPPKSDALARGAVSIQDADFRWGGPVETTKDNKSKEEEGAAETSPFKPLEQVDESKQDELDVIERASAATSVAPVVMSLRDISIQVAPGTLCLVCGITGGGKSSLLSALIGEIRRVKGTVRVSGSTAYCPQTAWCQNATIRENICFGSPFDEDRFLHCVDACALGADLDSLPGGDGTEVGERGVTLSGGQQQRVALARAIYQEADIYILDDPLSAVDAHVGEHLFHRVVKDTLLKRGKTVILATHQIAVALPSADVVVILSSEGTIAAAGTLEEIQRTQRGKELFAEIVESSKPKDDSKKKKKKKKDETTPGGKGEQQQKPKENHHRLVREEERKAGAPAFKLFVLYVATAGAWFVFGSTLFVAQQPIKYVQSAALTAWISRMEKGARPLGSPAWIYLGWTAVFVILSLIAVIAQNAGSLRASKTLHERLAWQVLRCPISWYDRSPVGRIQNRFSTDIQSIDRNVSNAVVFVIRGVISPLVSLYAIGSSVWWLLPCFIPMLAAAFQVAVSYLHVARDLKRIDSTTKSPVYACFNESLNGLSTLRAFDGAFDRFKAKFSGLVDRTNSAELSLFAANFWLSVRLNTLGASVTGLTAIVLYATASTGNGLSPPKAGLVLSYAVSFTSAMIMLLRTYTDLEISLNAVERVQEYLDLPIEPELELPGDAPHWLVDTPGEVRYERVTLRYPSQPEPALKALSLVVESGESLGICGRTGAGKSTALQSLLRLYPIEGGRIVIDGVDVATVGLKALRGRIAIVPQEPTLFAGTIRHNLDMFNERTDDELLDALAQSRGSGLPKSASHNSLAGAGGSHASLTSLGSEPDETVTELGLDYELHEFGTNLSVGERQLVCLARAIARRSRLVLMDEATANVDQRTDRRVQEILRSGSLSKATRITIAHRLGTIIYCDRVCVLSLGELKELASPAHLLNDTKSMFYSMCDAQGNVDALRATAMKAERERRG